MDFNSDANYENKFYEVYPSQEVSEEVKKENKRLCDTYPFLIPSNRFSGKRINSGEKGYWPGSPEIIPQWDYEYTELDEMPDGWRKAFGEQMCEEIKQALLRYEDVGEKLLDRYRIVQIKEKYGCYDDQTEVLTKDGWKFFKDITFNDKFATLDSDGETLIYQSPIDIINESYEGKMYHLENRGISLVVTPNHNLYVAKGSYYNHKNNQKRLYPFELCNPNKYFGKDKRFKKGCKWIGEKRYDINSQFIIPEYHRIDEKPFYREYIYPGFTCNIKDFLKFLGFYIAEGCVCYRKNKEKQITQIGEITVSYNPYDEEELVTSLIKNIGFEPKQGGKGLKRFSYCAFAHWLYDNCGHLAQNKQVPTFIKTLSPELIKIFLEYLFIGDGHKTKTSNILTTTSKQLCNDVCELLLKAGYAFKYTTRIRHKNNNSIIQSKMPVYEINWLKLTEIEIDNSKIKKSQSFIENYEQYNGNVYCVTIPNHILYIRRNGKGVWCGNSLRWYDNFSTVKIQGIIRKYETISQYTCIRCGAPATKITRGWISPFCDACVPENTDTLPIREYWENW